MYRLDNAHRHQTISDRIFPTITNARVLITGAAGMVGRYLVKCLQVAGYQVIPVDLVMVEGIIPADLRDESCVVRLIKTYTPDLVLHLAALTQLNVCEQNKTASHTTNYGITKNLANACVEFQLRLIFLSSDYVFGKDNYLWKEDDLPCPTTQYGIDKAASEALIQNSFTDYVIVRTAQLYGFDGDFVSLVCSALTDGQKFIAFANLVNCPTWLGDLWAMLQIIIQRGHRGIFHCVGPEPLSRYQYAWEIAQAFALDTTLIEPTKLDFSIDIRPPIVRLSGINTYDNLQFYPGKLRENLPFCGSSVTSNCAA